MIAYLDTNVFDHLYRKIGCTGADIAELRKTIYGHSLSMPIGTQVLEELVLSRRVSPQELVARVKLTLSLASIRRMVKPGDQLIVDDLRCYAATGECERPFVNAQVQNAITQGIAELIESDGEEFSEELVETFEAARQSRNRFLQAIELWRPEISNLLEALPLQIGFDDYFDRVAPAMAERLAQGAGVLETCRERGIAGLLQLKSVRATIGTVLSLIYEETHEDWAPATPGLGDFLHVPAATAAAEILVTNQPRLQQAAERVALNGIRALSLSEFLAVIGREELAP